MSLYDAMEEIADDLEENAKEFDECSLGYQGSMNLAKRIRSALKAAGKPTGGNLRDSLLAYGGDAMGSNPQQEQISQILQVKEQNFKRESKELEAAPSMVICVDGDLDGDMVAIDPQMPAMAKTLLAGQVYVLSEARQLVYSKEETEKLIAMRAKP